MPNSSVLKNILDAVQSEIQSLSLTDIVDANVQVIKVFTGVEERVPGIPGILILPLGNETSTPATNASNDIGYPVAIGMFAADCEADQTSNYDRNLYWREEIRNHFVRQRLSGVTSVWDCIVEPREIVDPFKWRARNLWQGTLIMRFVSREQHG